MPQSSVPAGFVTGAAVLACEPAVDECCLLLGFFCSSSVSNLALFRVLLLLG